MQNAEQTKARQSKESTATQTKPNRRKNIKPKPNQTKSPNRQRTAKYQCIDRPRQLRQSRRVATAANIVSSLSSYSSVLPSVLLSISLLSVTISFARLSGFLTPRSPSLTTKFIISSPSLTASSSLSSDVILSFWLFHCL